MAARRRRLFEFILVQRELYGGGGIFSLGMCKKSNLVVHTLEQ